MASTNKTPGLELSQFLATDKPSWLGDYNSDMSKIDTGYTSIKAEAEGAAGDATNAKNIANNAVATANNAVATANSAASAVNNLSTNINGWVTYTFPNPNVSKFTSYSLIAVYNTTLQIISMYGSINSNSPFSAGEVLFVLPEIIRPKSDIYIYSPGYIATSGANANSAINIILTATNGNVILNSAATTENNFRMTCFLTMSGWGTT